jgi:acyl dehydratase
MRFDPHEVYVGKDVGGRECLITPELIARHEEGTGDRHPWYRGGSPFGGAVAPVLLFHSEVYRNLSWYLPNLIGNLHAKQEWEVFAPMELGGTVRTRSTVVERYRKRNRDYIVNEVLITDREGRWLQRSRTHQSFLAEEPGSMDRPVVDKEREKRPERRFDLAEGPGEELPPVSKTITLPMCQAFSGPERNYHNDREMARMLGFPDIVVQGMMSICFLSELMTVAFGEGWFLGGKLSVNLVNVVWAEERVQARGKVREEIREGSHTRVLLDVWSEKDDGVKTVVGTASALRS